MASLGPSMRRILRRSVAASAGSAGGGAAKKKSPGRAARGMKIAKIDESVGQKATRTPVVKAVLSSWVYARWLVLLALAMPPPTFEYITPP